MLRPRTYDFEEELTFDESFKIFRSLEQFKTCTSCDSSLPLAWQKQITTEIPFGKTNGSQTTDSRFQNNRLSKSYTKTLHLVRNNTKMQGLRSKFSSGGAEEECVKENVFWGAGGGMLVDFYSISLK